MDLAAAREIRPSGSLLDEHAAPPSDLTQVIRRRGTQRHSARATGTHADDDVALCGRLEDRRVVGRKPHDERRRETAEEPAERDPNRQGAGAGAPALTCCFRWWRGEDLNLRPSGYEPAAPALPCSRLVPWSTADEAIRATFVTSSLARSRAVPKRTAEFTAPRAIQNHIPRRVADR